MNEEYWDRKIAEDEQYYIEEEEKNWLMPHFKD